MMKRWLWYNMDKKQKLRKWNWGAFSLNVIWGIFHRSYWTFLCFIPFFGTFWMIVCGIKGNEWAWKNGHYASIDEFEEKEFIWDILGIVVTICIVINILNEFIPSSTTFVLK